MMIKRLVVNMEGKEQQSVGGGSGQNVKRDSSSSSTGGEPKARSHAAVHVRKFEAADDPEVQRIFHEGLMEMVTDTAFRGLRHHPESLLLYAVMTTVCFVVTASWLVTGLVPPAVLCARYYCSRRVAHRYLEDARRGDMADIQAFYLKSPDSCMWVAVWEGVVVGTVAAAGDPERSGDLELRRMSVDRRHRHRGVGGALGRAVLQFAAAHRGGYSSVVLGTTAYSPAAHRLYRRLGFRHVGEIRGHVANDDPRDAAGQSMLERMFYRVSHHLYSLDVLDIAPPTVGGHKNSPSMSGVSGDP